METIFTTNRIQSILPSVKEFVQDELYPLEHLLLNRSFKELEGHLDQLRKKVKSLGWWAPQIPEEAGGMGLDLVEFGQLSEVLGRSPLGHYVFNCQAPDSGNMELMLHYAKGEIRKTFLEPLIQGDIRSCFAMTEPEFAGSNPVKMATTANLIDGNYVIDGHKWFTSSADGAAFTIAMVMTDPNASNPYQRASMILVPLDNPGYKLERNIPVMGEEGEGYFSHGEVRFSNCKVPENNLLGSRGMGFKMAQERLGPGRIHHCMRWIGICERALEMMCQRAVSRELKHGNMLSDMQTIQNWIAESHAGITASRLMVLNTASKMQKLGQKDVKEDISTIKFYVAGILLDVLDKAIQVHGALGITDDTVLSFWYRHERGARIYDGPDEVHKAVLARTILKKYRNS